MDGLDGELLRDYNKRKLLIGFKKMIKELPLTNLSKYCIQLHKQHS